MPEHRTLFIPGLYGQHLIWRNEVKPVCDRVDSIISFGNLIGCDEEASDGTARGRNQAVLSFVSAFRTYFENWTQLVGPNEIAALNNPGVWTNDVSNDHLRNGWLASDGVFHVASANDSRLQSNGGLTYGEWVAIGRPKDAQTAAQRLNEKYRQTLYQGPCQALGDSPNFSANPIWADPISETYPSWITAPEPCPFDQVHSSIDLNNRLGRRLVRSEDSLLSYLDRVNYRTFGSNTVIKGAKFQAVYLPIQGKTVKRIPPGRSLLIQRVR